MKKIILHLSVLTALILLNISCKSTETQVIADINKFCDIFHKLTAENDSLKIVVHEIELRNQSLIRENQQLKKK